MSTEKIIQMAFELGNNLAQSEEAVAMQAMQEKVSQDQDAALLLNQYQDARTKLENKIRDGLEIMPAEQQQIQALEEQLRGNSTIQELIQVQEKFNNLMQGVNFAMNQALTGGDCSSDCSSCGGSCNQ